MALGLHGQPTTFLARIGLGAYSTQNSLLLMPNGDVMIAGTTGNPSHGFLARIDNLGQLLWHHAHDPRYELQHLYAGPGDHVFACGVRDTAQGTPNVIVGYLDGTGQNQWLKMLDEGEYHRYARGAILGNGKLLVCASGDDFFGSEDYIAVIDTLGQVAWEHHLPSSIGFCAAAIGGDGAIIARKTVPEYSTLTRLDGLGNIIWSRKANIDAQEVAVLGDSLLYVGGRYPTIAETALLLELDTAGSILQSWNFSSTVMPGHIRFTPTGDLLLSGDYFEDLVWLPIIAVRYGIFRPATGQYLLPTIGRDDGTNMSQMWETSDGGYVFAYTDMYPQPSTILIQKRDALVAIACDTMALPALPPYTWDFEGDTALTTTSMVTNGQQSLPPITMTADTLDYQIECPLTVGIAPKVSMTLTGSPNPVVSQLRLRWATQDDQGGSVQIQIWNMSGRLVAEFGLPNDGEALLDWSMLPSGSYVVRLMDAHGKADRLTVVKE